jgi:TonB-dependent SusC/RagA subfamily outer membrane receptor
MKISKAHLFIMILFVGFCYSQNKLSGRVVNSKNKPVSNAKIYLDSIYSDVETDRKGNFELSFTQKVAMINVYSNEYGLLSNKFNNEKVINFMFLNSPVPSGERIQKGGVLKMVYSKQTNEYKIDNTKGSSVETDKNSGVYNTIYDLIRGRLPGVSVSRNNSITIRGVSSLRNISEPLFVVDGVIVSSIDFISPNNVKKVSVLKGAEASIYGSQASSGVILIKTK